MLKNNTKRVKILNAAMKLAEEHGWRKLTVPRIAKAAGVSLADMRRKFRSKGAILESFAAEIDKAVLDSVKPAEKDAPARDRVFDVVMTRFEMLAPYKDALKRIRAEACCAPDATSVQLACASLRSQYWMLTAAGVPADGARGCVRVPGMLAVYCRVAPVWLEDDDEGLARTMAALDRELRSAERWLCRIEDLCRTASRIVCAFAPRRRERGEPGPQGDGEPAGAPSAG